MSRFKLCQLAILTISALVVLPACDDDVSAPDSPVPYDVTLAQLASAPETLDLPSQDYHLETDLWRDFMPISPPDGKPLIAVVRLVSDAPIPDDVKLVYLWVVSDGRVWATKFAEEPVVSGNTTEGVARGGPKWGPDIAVDVVVGVKIGNDFRLVRAAKQPITATF
jgi:hypothetical protein